MDPFIAEQILQENEIRFDVYSKLIQNRIIFLDDLTNDEIAADIVATLLHLDAISHDKITIFINLEGADIRNVFMIYDTMKILTSPIETFCIGVAMHEAVLLLAAGTKGLRLISKNADICLSQVLNPGFSHSDLTNTKIFHQKVQKDNENFLKELSKCIKKPLRALKKDTERQLFLTASEAVAYGVVDKVL